MLFTRQHMQLIQQHIYYIVFWDKKDGSKPLKQQLFLFIYPNLIQFSRWFNMSKVSIYPVGQQTWSLNWDFSLFVFGSQDSFNNLKKYQRLKLFEVRFGPTGPLLNCDFLNFSSQWGKWRSNYCSPNLRPQNLQRHLSSWGSLYWL